MDLKRLATHRSLRRKRRKGDATQLAAQLAPLEEQPGAVKGGIDPRSGNGQSDPDFAAITVDKDPSMIPRDMLEEGGEKTFLGMEPVVLVILGLMLAFIAFIAWQITLMPAK
jgi:hypothetical protein